MRKLIALAALALMGISQSHAADGLESMESNHDVDTTLERLLDALNEAGMNVFGEVDHAAGAAEAGMELPPTHVVMFGNPEIGTQLMQCDRSAAIDLPMKALIWEEDGSTYIGYNSADYLADRHGLEDCDEVLEQVAGALDNFATQAAGK